MVLAKLERDARDVAPGADGKETKPPAETLQTVDGPDDVVCGDAAVAPDVLEVLAQSLDLNHPPGRLAHAERRLSDLHRKLVVQAVVAKRLVDEGLVLCASRRDARTTKRINAHLAAQPRNVRRKPFVVLENVLVGLDELGEPFLEFGKIHGLHVGGLAPLFLQFP